MTDKKSLTELEGATLAIVAMEETTTAYYIKEVFRRSPSEMWSGSAGAIYPLVKRLVESGLLIAQDSPDGSRKRRLFSLSSAGEKAMRDWLFDLERASGMGTNPLRTRLFFAANRSYEGLRQFLEQVEPLLDKPSLETGNPLSDRIHKIWLAKHREAFREIADLLLQNREDG